MRHEHEHLPRAFALGVGLNGALVVVQVIAGLAFHSVAVIADAAHNFGDVLGLVLAWIATLLARRKPSPRRTYGFHRSTILAALMNAVLLFVSVGAIAWESIGRLRNPVPIDALPVLIVAVAGVAVNTISALGFRERHGDMNARAAFAHLMSDAAVSFGVAVGALIFMLTKYAWIDPAISLAISATILIRARSLLRESLDLALDAVPDRIEPDRVRTFLSGLPGVSDVHDLHIWAISTTDVALTAHLIVPSPVPSRFLRDVCNELRKRFAIEHATLQVELGDRCDPSVVHE